MNNLIIAHRGVFNNLNIPENSIKAFKKALRYNYPIELDVHLTKDNILVVFHDHNLKRMTGINKNIQDLTYDEIKKLNLLDTNEKIPTLKEVLELINNKILLDIEVKNTKRIKDTCNLLLKELENYSNYDLKSFNPRIVRYLKKKNPNLIVGYLIENKYHNKLYNLLLKNNFIIKYCNPDFLAINKKLLNNKKFKKIVEKYPTMLWTIKNKQQITTDKYIYICNNLPY